MAAVSTCSSSPLEMPAGSARACSAAAANAWAARGSSAIAAPAGGDATSGTSRHSRPRRQHVLGAWAHALYLQIEDACGIETQNIALGLLGEERQGGDGTRWVEVPVRPIGREQQLRLGLHGIEGRLQQLHVAPLQRLAGEVHLADVLARQPLEVGRLAYPHHELVVEPLHDERNPG